MDGVNGEQEDRVKLPDHTSPSDYMDVQPKSYDPEYISQINSKMQVPDRISFNVDRDRTNGSTSAPHTFSGMSVPDKIVVAGDNQHIGLKQDMSLDVLPSGQLSSESLAYVGLITPPRTLTLEETFPVVEDTVERKASGELPEQRAVGTTVSNGQITAPVPYDPGVSLQDSVLLNEEDEATLLRTQVAKLTRRVQVIEQDNQKRAHREIVIYPIVLGYLLWKFLSFFTRDR